MSGKDPTNPTNYRPIVSLKPGNEWSTVDLSGISNSTNCSLMYNVGLDQDVVRLIILLDLKLFVGKLSSIVSVFFYLENTYDTTWKYGIMKDLHGIGIRGRLPNFIVFLKDRFLKVRVRSTFSDYHPQETGVPQGSILKFSMKINSITQCLKPGVICRWYSDLLEIVQYEYYRINVSNGQLTVTFDSQRQKQSVCISARKEVSI